jgi:hypothetical protein
MNPTTNSDEGVTLYNGHGMCFLWGRNRDLYVIAMYASLQSGNCLSGNRTKWFNPADTEAGHWTRSWDSSIHLELSQSTGSIFCRWPEHRSCHGMPRRVQAFMRYICRALVRDETCCSYFKIHFNIIALFFSGFRLCFPQDFPKQTMLTTHASPIHSTYTPNPSLETL